MGGVMTGVKRKPGRPRKNPEAILPNQAETTHAEAEAIERDDAPQQSDAGSVPGAAGVGERFPVELPSEPHGHGEPDLGGSSAPEPRRRGLGRMAPTDGEPDEANRKPAIATHIGPLELDALKREAWEAFDYQEPRGKTDTLGRIWGFVPETRNNNTVVTFTLRRPGGEPLEISVSTADYGRDGARDMSDSVVEDMNGRFK